MLNLDFTFAWEGASPAVGPWRHLQVVELRGAEGMSALYRYEITLLAREPAPEVDPDDLVRARVTLRIGTGTEPRFRLVHGILTEAEELGPTHGGMVYRVVLSPPLARAMHRTRCRIFLDKTVRQIVDAVLQGDPEMARADGAVVEPDEGLSHDYRPARELYAWRVIDASRLDQVAARPYVVQYNESDLAFVSRLLEEEGIGYHFENGSGICLLVLSDSDAGRARLDPPLPLGPEISGRAVSSMKLGARLRPRKVSLQDYNWKKPALGMAVEEPGSPGATDLVDHAYPGRYPDTPDQGKPLAAARLGRLETEASYAVGEGACRVLSVGSIFTLEHLKPRYEGEYLVTRLDVRGFQGGVLSAGARATTPEEPYRCTFECARRGKDGKVAESRFRPARVTPKPRIVGPQTAFVTAEPSAQGAEIHVGGPPGAEIGCVRLRFHWDQGDARLAKEPSSCWVRVSQVFAGPGQGAVWHPRVGVEVIVDHEDGDPDRPIVVGRVYNGQNQPPTVVPTVSTFKTMTSPGDGTFNELTFDDTAGAQQIKLHTPKDWNCEVGNDRSETVAANSTSSVGVDRSEATGADRSTMVGGNNTEMVGGNEQVTVGANQTVGVGGDQDVSVTKDQTVTITGDQTVIVEGQQTVNVTKDRTVDVKMNLNETVALSRTTTVTQNDSLTVKGQQDVTVTGLQVTTYQADHQLTVENNQQIRANGAQTVSAKSLQQVSSDTEQALSAPIQVLTSNMLSLSATTTASLNAPIITLSGDGVSLSGKKLTITFDEIVIGNKSVTIQGSKIDVKGSTITMDGGQEVTVQAAIIKLN